MRITIDTDRNLLWIEADRNYVLRFDDGHMKFHVEHELIADVDVGPNIHETMIARIKQRWLNLGSLEETLIKGAIRQLYLASVP